LPTSYDFLERFWANIYGKREAPMRPKSKEPEVMVDLKRWDTQTLIRCHNSWCGEISFKHEYRENDWKCPHCGKRISKPE
jgi:rubrerythrin